jgi:hypothetical protein
MRKPSRPLTRPLLFVGAGLAVVTVAAGCFTSGNLVAPPPCPDGGLDFNGDGCAVHEDAGTDGGTPDAGVDAGP